MWICHHIHHILGVLFLQDLFSLSDGVVTLTSSARGAICPGEEVILTCTVTGGVSLEWSSAAFSPVVRFVGNDPVGQPIDRGIFTATLTFTPALADLTSTLRVTATPEAMLNGTVVTCSDQVNPVSITLTLAGLPTSPRNPSFHVQHYGPHNVTVTVQWGYPEFDGGVPVNNYTISGTNIMTTTSQINETTLTLPYNASQTIKVAGTNCNGTSGMAMLTYFQAGCGEPILPSRGLIENFQSAAEGATITYSCSPGLVPGTQMSAVCTNMTWRPDPATLECRQPADCGAPPSPINGSLLQPCTSTTEGSVVVFQCDPGFVPDREVTAVCGGDGQWTPNPGDVTCNPRPTQTFTETSILIPSATPDPTRPEPQLTRPGSSNERNDIIPLCSTSVAITAVVSCAVSFITGALVGAVVYYCIMRKKSDCKKCYTQTVAHKQQQQPAPVHEDVIGQSQNIELKENVAYGPVQQ